MMMVALIDESNHARLGAFEFDVLPTIESTIYVPDATDAEGFRIFVISDIWHFAEGMVASDPVAPQRIALVGREIT